MYSLITGDVMNKFFCFRKLVYELYKSDFNTYNNSYVEFYAVVTNVETGKAEYINENIKFKIYTDSRVSVHNLKYKKTF